MEIYLARVDFFPLCSFVFVSDVVAIALISIQIIFKDSHTVSKSKYVFGKSSFVLFCFVRSFFGLFLSFLWDRSG